jgi:hypothetical protein
MKQFFTVTLFAAILLLLLVPNQSFAKKKDAPNDTLVIYATPSDITLDSIVSQDQHSGQIHHVYKLVSTDTVYTFMGTVAVDNNVTFLGVPDPTTKRLPCIMPNVLPDNSVPGHLFTFAKPSTVIKIKNLYLLGVSIQNTVNWGDGFGISVNADSIKCYIDNCVFEQWGQFGINYAANWNSFFITNCKFRNFINHSDNYTGEVLRNRNDLGSFYTDTIMMRNNTFLAVCCYVCCPVTGAYHRYLDFQHNTIVCTFKNPFFMMNETHAIVAHNILYSTYAGGLANGEYPWWDELIDPAIGSIIDFDTLLSPNAVMLTGNQLDTNIHPAWDAEALRDIKINDNIYFTPASITNYIQAWNDTAHVDSVYTAPWENAVTQALFADKGHWPLMNDDNNLNTDPGYGSGIATMIGAPGTTVPADDGIGFLPWFTEYRTQTITAALWGYAMAAPDFSSGNWVPTWPLPEETSGDLAYTASLTASDGQKYGDPYWFTHTPTNVAQSSGLNPNSFSISPAYPNPFNPSTNFTYQIGKAGFVSVKIYDLLGREVATLVNEVKLAGSYPVKWDAASFSSGIYFCKMQSGSFAATKKLVLMK